MSDGLSKEVFEKMMAELSKNIPTSPFGGFMDSIYKPMEIKFPDPEPDNTQFRFISRMWGIPVYTSNHAYQTVTKLRGLPSKIKPNTRRPLYRKVTIKNPVMYAVKGMGIISPPGYLASMA